MKRYSFFLVFIFFLAALSYPGFSLPNKILILSQENPAEKNTLSPIYTFGDNKYLGVKFIIREGKQRWFKIYIVDLEKKEKIYETKFKLSEERDNYVPNVNHFSTIYHKYLIYTLYDTKKKLFIIHRVNLKRREESTHILHLKKIVFDFLRYGKNGELFIIDEPKEKVDKIYVYNFLKDKIKTYTIPSDITSESYNILIFHHTIISFFGDMLLWYNLDEKKSFKLGYYGYYKRVPNLNQTINEAEKFDPSTPMLPVISKDKINIYDDKWCVAKSYKFSDIGIKESVADIHKFLEIASSSTLFIFKLEFKDRATYLIFDNQGNIIKKILNVKKKDEKVIKLKNNGLALLVKKPNNRWYIAYPENFVEIPILDINYKIWGDKGCIISGKYGYLLKYNISDGKISGTYLFPKAVTIGHIYNNDVYVTTHDPYGYIDIESFPLSSHGWINTDTKFSPTTGNPFELYENTKTRITIPIYESYGYNTISSLGGLKIGVDKGKIKKDGINTWIWDTPHFEKEEEDAILTLKIMSIKKEIPVKIVKPDNPLVLSITENNPFKNPWIFGIKVKITNPTNTRLSNLMWDIKIEELKEIRKTIPHDIWSALETCDNQPNNTTYLKAWYRPYPYKTQIKWNGYTIESKIHLTLNYKWGHFEKDLKKEFKVEPKYGFFIKLKDKNGHDINLIESNLKDIKVLTKEGKEITNNLKITFAPHSYIYKEGKKMGSLIEVSGISPGFPGKPLNLIVKWGGYKKKVALSFDVSMDSYEYRTPTITFKGIKTKL